ncbi:YjdJ family protein [Psychrobacillus sp. NPDC093200]|uniref:YjdJ family protein n=1 Tax=Psychrobacillus sp. NPDC093200 TaxID=3390656 RepID=UPI003D080C09
MKQLIQAGLAIMVLVFSTIAAWYEGSTLIHSTWEWKHTAIFSKWINGSVNHANDIWTIDYFIYAAKFAPAYPLAMLVSGMYLLILIGFVLFKGNTRPFYYFLACVGIMSFVLCSLVSGSPTTGLKMLFNTSLLLGILAVVISLTFVIKNNNKEITN